MEIPHTDLPSLHDRAVKAAATYGDSVFVINLYNAFIERGGFPKRAALLAERLTLLKDSPIDQLVDLKDLVAEWRQLATELNQIDNNRMQWDEHGVLGLKCGQRLIESLRRLVKRIAPLMIQYGDRFLDPKMGHNWKDPEQMLERLDCLERMFLQGARQ